MTARLERFFRSRWWFVGSFVIPAFVAGAGGIYLACIIGSQHAEILKLKAQLTECAEEVKR